jgi:hypothetical protein
MPPRDAGDRVVQDIANVLFGHTPRMIAWPEAGAVSVEALRTNVDICAPRWRKWRRRAISSRAWAWPDPRPRHLSFLRGASSAGA